MHHEDEQILENNIALAFGANVNGNAKHDYENPGDARPAGAGPPFSRLQSDEASYRVFLLAVTLLLKAEFTSMGVVAP